MGRLKKLKELDLSYNEGLSEFPQVIGLCQQLENIYLYSNRSLTFLPLSLRLIETQVSFLHLDGSLEAKYGQNFPALRQGCQRVTSAYVERFLLLNYDQGSVFSQGLIEEVGRFVIADFFWSMIF